MLNQWSADNSQGNGAKLRALPTMLAGRRAPQGLEALKCWDPRPPLTQQQGIIGYLIDVTNCLRWPDVMAFKAHDESTAIIYTI